MCIWNKILLGLICVATLAFFYLGLRTLKTHQHWREAAIKHQLAIKDYNERSDRLINGETNKPGIRQFKVDLARVLLDRNRVWHNCEAKVTNAAKDTGTAEVHITIDQSKQEGLTVQENTLLYAFTESEVKDKGAYLGEFVVTAVDDKEVTLKPAGKLTGREITRLSSAKGPWLLCETMPCDNHEVFADLSEEEKKAILPAETIAEYVKDGTPAEADAPPESVVDGKTVRFLRNYQYLFNTDRVNWTEMVDLAEATNRDKVMMESALATAKELEVAKQKQVAREKDKLEKFSRERDIVATHRKALEDKIAVLTKRIAEVIETNKTMANQIARDQWDAVRRIDERTRAMAPSDAKGL